MRSNPRYASSFPLLLLSLLLAAPLGAADFFVAPGAGGGDGSRRAPWDLATALAQPPAVRPGDTLWLAGGVYRGTFTSTLRGTPAAPVLLRALPGARVTLDGGDSGGVAVLTVGGAYTWYQGFEVTSSDPRRQSAENGSWPADIRRGEGIVTLQRPGEAVGVRLLDLAIHDTRQGISLWTDAVDAVVSGCVIYDNGWDGASDRGHGHGIYTQNGAGRKVIAANVIFGQFGGGIVAYGSEKARLDGLDIEGNTVFDNGTPSRHGVDRNLLVGGGRVARDGRIRGNVTFYRRGSANNLGYDAGCAGMEVEGNAFVNLSGPALTLSRCAEGLRLDRNVFVGGVEGASPERFPRNAWDDRARRPRVFVQESRSGSGRAVITVLGGEGAATATVDAAKLLAKGEPFAVRNAEDPFAPPLLAGIYRGGALRLPLEGLRRAAPAGGGRAVPHDPALAVFLLDPAPRERPADEAGRGRPLRQDDERGRVPRVDGEGAQRQSPRP